jgi:nicotinate dehydrogenase subunit A
MIDGEVVRSCQTKASSAAGRSVTTLAGLMENGKASKLQQAFIDEQAAQCGFCLNAVILTAKAFLDEHPRPSDAELQEAMSGVLCRCFVQHRMMRAIRRYADTASTARPAEEVGHP